LPRDTGIFSENETLEKKGGEGDTFSTDFSLLK
jgi:hypothetical protein